MLEEEFVLVIVHVHVPYRRHDGRFQIPDVGLPSAMHVLRDTRTTIYECIGRNHGWRQRRNRDGGSSPRDTNAYLHVRVRLACLMADRDHLLEVEDLR